MSASSILWMATPKAASGTLSPRERGRGELGFLGKKEKFKNSTVAHQGLAASFLGHLCHFRLPSCSFSYPSIHPSARSRTPKKTTFRFNNNPGKLNQS